MPTAQVQNPKFLKLHDGIYSGGLICTIGQLINNLAKIYYGMNKEEASTITSITLIFIAALLTGLGLYEKIGKRAGAGSIVPITGFSNSIVAPAMEHKREGYVLGVGAKLFSIAGSRYMGLAHRDRWVNKLLFVK